MPFEEKFQEQPSSSEFHLTSPARGPSEDRRKKKRERTSEGITAQLILNKISNPLYDPRGHHRGRGDAGGGDYEEKRNFWMFQAWKMLHETKVQDPAVEAKLKEALMGFHWENRAYAYVSKQPDLLKKYGNIFRRETR